MPATTAEATINAVAVTVSAPAEVVMPAAPPSPVAEPSKTIRRRAGGIVYVLIEMG